MYNNQTHSEKRELNNHKYGDKVATSYIKTLILLSLRRPSCILKKKDRWYDSWNDSEIVWTP